MEGSTTSATDSKDDVADAIRDLSIDHAATRPYSTRPPLPHAKASHPSSPTIHRRSSKHVLERTSSTSLNGDFERSNAPTTLLRKVSTNSLREGIGLPPSPTTRRTPSSPVAARTLPNQAAKQPITAGALARDYLQKYITNGLGSAIGADGTETAVVLQDDCYGHRYARPKTSRAGLSTIVERPERIHAALIGAATAYIRLRGLHSSQSAAPTSYDWTGAPLAPAPFTFLKTSRRVALTSPAVTAVHGTEWMTELSAMCHSAEKKLVNGGKDLSRPTSSDKSSGAVPDTKPKLHEGDLYLCSKSLDAFEGAIGGVCEAVDQVFGSGKCKRCFVCIRPPGHHCSSDMPSGFCWVNNVHIGISHAAIHHGLTHAVIIDFDLHHGDGSQTITWAHNSKMALLPRNTPMTKKRPIGYFSLHDINSYPCEGGDEEKVRGGSLCIENAHGQSIWNVHLQPWKTEEQFWKLYETRYSIILEKARSFLRSHSERLREHPTHPAPKAAIFFSAGFDASEWESPHMQRHQVNVLTAFYDRITRDVIRIANQEDLGVDGRVISVLEGGYSDRALTSGVLSHMCGLVNREHGLPRQMPPLHGDILQEGVDAPSKGQQNGRRAGASDGCIDPAWWDSHHLDLLEETLKPTAVPEVPKKRRSDVKPTYTSATESFKAKIVPTAPGRRSLSGSLLNSSAVPIEPRAVTPPLPDVDWATAVVELGRLLVPDDRETGSHRPEELNVEATRVRREKLLGESSPTVPDLAEPNRMHLREKRAKAVPSGADQVMRPPSRTSRRRTIADVTTLASDESYIPAIGQGASTRPNERVTRRRSSAASSITSAISITDHRPVTMLDQTLPVEPVVTKTSGQTSKPRAEPQKAGVMKRPPVSRKSSKSSTSGRIAEEVLSENGSSNSQIHSIAEGNVEQHNVDQLASSMKKMSIKLNVPSREEHDARQKAAKTGARVKQSIGTADRKVAKQSVPVRTKTKTTSPSKARGKVSQPPQTLHEKLKKGNESLDPASGSGQQSLDHGSLQQVLTKDERRLSSSPPPKPSSLDSQDQAKPESPEFRAFPGQSQMVDQSNSDIWRPSLSSSSYQQLSKKPTGTPTSSRWSKEDLPVFTSTSPIRFAAQASEQGKMLQKGDNGFAQEGLVAHPLNPPTATETSSTSASEVANLPFGKKSEGLDEQSVWDVPESPQIKKPAH